MAYIRISAYTDKLSVKPGDTLRVMASTDATYSVRAQLVQLIHGDGHLDGPGFGDFFLAMRPVRCLTGPREQLCHFPYGKRNVVSLSDLSALEYQLLFMHKKASTVSLDPRDGMYWILHVEGDRLVGELQDADLDPIVAPQGDADHPLTKEYLQPADESSHWLPRLTIE